MISFKKIISVVLSIVIAVCAFSSCASEKEVIIPDEDGWFCAWAAAMQTADIDQLPQNPRLKENTLRQVIRPSISGDKFTLTFSNEYGDIPAIFESVHVAKLLKTGNPAIDTATDTVVTFGGKEEIRIEAGETVTSDEISLSVSALDLLAVSIKMGSYVGGDVSCHREANASCWVAEGNCVSAENMSGFKVMGSWYYLCRMDVWAKAGAKTLVVMGDSISDGVGATSNAYATWPDQLAALMNKNASTENISVVNLGISGDIVSGDWGVAKGRYKRDILDVSGVRYCILLIGINDIGGAQEDISERLIESYKSIISACHEKGIKVYAGTLLPVKGNFYYSELHEKIRLAVNNFMMSEDSGFDGVIDFSGAVCRDDDPAQMKDEYNSPWKDFLHPGDKGYEKMAECAYDSLLKFWTEQPTDK